MVPPLAYREAADSVDTLVILTAPATGGPSWELCTWELEGNPPCAAGVPSALVGCHQRLKRAPPRGREARLAGDSG